MSESNNHKIAEININGEKYKVSVYLSINDTISVLDYCKDNDYDIDNDLCRAVISKIISNHIIENQSMITIEEIKEDTFAISTYVNLLINENADLNAAYNKLQDEENICIRFVKAVYDMSQNMTANVMHSIGDSIKSIQAVLPPIKDIAYNMQSILKPIFDFTNQIGEMIANISNTFNSFFEGIQFPTISDERKKELGEIYALWGEYGWTMIPDLEFCYLEDSPATQKYANKLALNYCDAETITNLFNITKTLNGVKAKDYEEAIECLEEIKEKEVNEELEIQLEIEEIITEEETEIAVDVSADAEAPATMTDQVRSWVVANGQTLREVLQSWCDKEGWDLVWTTSREYPIEASAVFKGRFVDVASALVRNFGRATPVPYAKFYKGNRVLVVSTVDE